MSVINYGSSIWGGKEFSSISSVHNRAGRYYLGLRRYTPNAALQGELGWKTPLQRQWSNIASQWSRLVNMPVSRLNKRVFNWCNEKASNVCKNLSFRVKKFCTQNNIQYFGTNDAQLNNVTFRKNVNSVAEGHVHAKWSRAVTRDNAIRGAGGNKLGTYAKTVENRETKFYVNCIMSKSHRSALAKFRCGVAPIRLETGRYEGLPVNERICPICMLEVEDEEHVLMRWSA